jgi:5-formyltetrahydrofolate cyclo-ligase
MERRHVARFPGARGRIPNFIGAEAAAERLAALPEWQGAAVIKANPDSPQLPVRARAITEGKRLYMAWPKLANDRPFIRIDPRRLPGTPRQAASIKGAESAGTPVAIDRMEHIDLIVCGTVAVNRRGVRIGKGGGYSDLEFALLTQAGLVDERTTIATTVHSLQVIDERLPETAHDFRVDVIVTPESVIRTQNRRRPPGIIWGDLDMENIDAIPVLRRLARNRR